MTIQRFNLPTKSASIISKKWIQTHAFTIYRSRSFVIEIFPRQTIQQLISPVGQWIGTKGAQHCYCITSQGDHEPSLFLEFAFF